MSKGMEECGVSVNLTQVPSSTTPLHIVMWKGADESRLQVQSLLDRITTLESMVAGLLESQKSSVWFPQCLRPTPAGLDVISRRESAGNDSDFGSLLSHIVRPSAPKPTELASMDEDTQLEGDTQLEDEVEGDAEVEDEVEEGDAEVAEDDAQLEAEVEEGDAEVAEDDAQLEAEVEEGDAQLEAEAEVEEGDAEVEDEVEEDDADAEVAEVEDEEVVEEYKEVEWKGRTYYVDSQSEVYEMDSDGDLIDTPIGVWREETKKLIRYKQ